MGKRVKCILAMIMAVLVVVPYVFYPAAEQTGGEICVAFTHDMHDHFEQGYREKNGVRIRYGGFSQVASVIGEIKSKNENTLVVDAGDFSMGTLFQTLYETEAPELELMGLMGYDYVTVGNSEFDFGAEAFAKMLIKASENADRPKLIASNIDFYSAVDAETSQLLSEAVELYGVGRYFVDERGGVKTAVFSVLDGAVQDYGSVSELCIEDPVDTAGLLVEQIKESENPDIIICLSHSGMYDDGGDSFDEELADRVPDIDLIIAAHSHGKLEEPEKIGDTYIVSCGQYTENVGSIVLKRDTDGNWALKEYELIPVDASVPKVDVVSDRIDDYRELVNSNCLMRWGYKYDTVLAYSPYSFTPLEELGLELSEDGLGNLISDSYIYAVKRAEGEWYDPVDAAIVPRGIIRDSITAGNVTVSDVYNVCPLGRGKDSSAGYPLVSVYVTGRELKAIVEADASLSDILDISQMYISGLSYEYNPNRLIFNRVTSVSLQLSDGSLAEIEDEELYRVIAGKYTVEMLSRLEQFSLGFIDIVPKDENGEAITDLNASIIYDGSDELKEWTSLAYYLSSFEKTNGISVIPFKYHSFMERKIEIDKVSWNLMFEDMNRASVVIMIILFIAFALLIVTLCMIVKMIKKLVKYVKRIRIKRFDK